MKRHYICIAVPLYIIHITIVRCSINSHSKQKEKEAFFYDPKLELQRSRTSGEETFINSQKKSHSSCSSLYSCIDVDKDKGTLGDGDDAFIVAKNRVYVDAINKNSIGKADDGSVMINSNRTKPNLNQHKILVVEFIPLSNPYGINSTTQIDQATFARIKNSVVEYYNYPQQKPTTVDKISLSSCYFLGLIHFYGLVPSHTNSGISDYNEAIQWFTIASNAGHSDAQCALGLFYYRGCDGTSCGISKDMDKAIYWFSKAVTLKNKHGNWLLGRALLYGKYWHGHSEEKEEVETSPLDDILVKEIINLFQVAADDNIPEAIHHLALLYEYGYIEIMDYDNSSLSPIKKAVELYHKALHLHYHESAYNLALIFTNGRGGVIKQDLIYAMELFRYLATEHHHIPSMRYLGIFAMNNGLFYSSKQPNYTLALYWFRECLSTPHTSSSEAEKYVRDLCRIELDELFDAGKAIVDQKMRMMKGLIHTNRSD